MLIGGATGVGKSTVAEGLARRLGAVRVVTTDAVREILRGAIPPEEFPALHVSSFEADDPDAATVAGFLEQVHIVGSGIRSLLARADVEQVDIIVEGVHLVPGAIQFPDRLGALVVPLIIAVDDVGVHRSYLVARSHDSRRPPDRYLDGFEQIRRIQREVVRRAREHGVATLRPSDPHAAVDEAVRLVERSLAHRGDAAGRLATRPGQ
ncbi:MAG TPA: hypothetical protein VHF25_01530 [Nitriliruptorales bacterium]|nr:hypothetical protein [Nitriliruptorales bacterium]